MDKRRVIACALAAELVAGGASVAARVPRDGATLAQVAGPASDPPPSPAPSPTPLLTEDPSATPTTVPSVVPTELPSPPITLPPLPSVSLPPLPSLPPLCAADAGASPLPAFTRSVDISGDDGPVVGPVSGGGRIWYTVQDSTHVSGVDVAGGSRVEIATNPDTIVIDVAGPYAWTIEGHHYAVAYHLSTREEALRYGREPTSADGLTYEVRGDAQGGAWLLAEDLDGTVSVVRVNGAGGQVWSTPLPGAAPNGWGLDREEYLAVRDGSAYVGVPSAGGTRTFWRVAPDGALAAQATLEHPNHNMVDLPVVAGPDGVYTMLYENDGAQVRVVRLDENLRVVASETVPAGFDLFVGAGAVWVSGSDCSYNLSRLDPRTLRRTHLWQTERGDEGLYGVVHEGHVWTLHAPESDPVALHRHDLP